MGPDLSSWWAFLRARHLPPVVAGAAVATAAAVAGSELVAQLPQLRGAEVTAGTLTIVALGLGALGGAVADSTSADLERRTVRRLWVMESGLYIAVAVTLTGLAFVLGQLLGPALTLAAVRNTGGVFGLVHFLVAACGLERAVVVSGLYLGAATFLAADPRGQIALWAWFLAPGAESSALWVGGVCVIAGLASATFRPSIGQLASRRARAGRGA